MTVIELDFEKSKDKASNLEKVLLKDEDERELLRKFRLLNERQKGIILGELDYYTLRNYKP